ncbi:MAG: Crp/Fnr family transcriptional regulator [Elusimicrobia bacterium]|nr:Crp/Fnr family transcriptional regulator [Elusimicrobiota bacterium]
MKKPNGQCGSAPLCKLRGWLEGQGLPGPVAGRIASNWRSNRYVRGNILFYQDNNPLALFFICSGRVKLVRTDKAGHSQIIRIIRGPGLAGERALVCGQPYAATAEVMEESHACFIDSGRFTQLWQAYPDLARFIARTLAGRLGESEDFVSNLSGSTVRERLAKALALQAQAQGDSLATFMLTESRQELAELLGTSPEVVSRTLAELARKRMISLQGRRVRVLDEARLRAAARLTPRLDDLNQIPGCRTSSRLFSVIAKMNEKLKGESDDHPPR